MQENPLMVGLGLPREPQPLTLVIFGASGDLTRRKLIPALFSLYVKGSIPRVRIVGFARRDWDTAAFQTLVRPWLDGDDGAAVDAELKDAFVKDIGFIRSSFEDAGGLRTDPKVVSAPRQIVSSTWPRHPMRIRPSWSASDRRASRTRRGDFPVL